MTTTAATAGSNPSNPQQIAFLRVQAADGRRFLEAELPDGLQIAPGAVLRLSVLGGAVGAVVVIEPPRAASEAGA